MKHSLILAFILAIAGINANAQYATRTLSNLYPTKINQSLLPYATEVLDLGSTTNLWRNAYFSGDALIHGLTIGLGAGAIYNNTVFGSEALHFNTSGYQNTATGYQALYSNTTGFSNTANGYLSLYGNTTGVFNTATGFQALYFNTNGNQNTANGVQALYSNTTGYYNTANGVYALFANTTGYYNTATGYQALINNINGSQNTATGEDALLFNSTGVQNTATGNSALQNSTTGYGNTADGSNALSSNLTGSYNTALGGGAGVNSGGFMNSTIIGYGALGTASNQVRIGSNSVTSIGGYVDWSNISDGRVKKNIKQNVPGLSFINQLQPVTYNLDLDAADNIVQPPVIKDQNGVVFRPSQEELDSRKAKEQIVYTGFVAQDVEADAKKIGYDFSGVDAPKNDKDLYALRYADFVAPLVKAVQELSQQNNDLKKEVEDLKAAMNGSDTKLQTSNSELQTAYLNQNSPNPFSQNTVISYFIPQAANNAMIKIYSLQGEEIKSFQVNDKDYGQISIAGSTLQAGVYAYVLIVDGVTIDTRQMILTK